MLAAKLVATGTLPKFAPDQNFGKVAGAPLSFRDTEGVGARGEHPSTTLRVVPLPVPGRFKAIAAHSTSPERGGGPPRSGGGGVGPSLVKPDSNVLTKAPAPVAEAPKAPAGPVIIPGRVDFQQAGCTPEYPRASLRNEETGVTRLTVTIGADGLVTDVVIAKSSGFRGLDNAVRAQLLSGSCKNKPGTVDGKPQATTTQVEYVWKLD